MPFYRRTKLFSLSLRGDQQGDEAISCLIESMGLPRFSPAGRKARNDIIETSLAKFLDNLRDINTGGTAQINLKLITNNL